MIRIKAQNPTALWIKLGETFFSPTWRDQIDLKLGDRRFVSIDNRLVITEWPAEWTGKDLFASVGYSSKGTKMKKLRETYVDEEQLTSLRCTLRSWKYSDCFRSIGMNFKMKQRGKGGCLSSFHLVRTKANWEVFVHAKICEVPRKFLGDMLLIKGIVDSLNGIGDERFEGEPVISYPFKVTFHLSTLYYSIVGLRAYIPFLGKENMDFHDLPIDKPRNYQASIIEAINQQKEIVEENELDYQTGEWK